MKNKRALTGYTLTVVGITALICLAVFIILGYRFWLKDGIEFEDDQSPSAVTGTSDTISIPGFDTWSIDAGKTKVSANFYNPEKNPCYFVLSVSLDDTGEVIYESKYLRPGQHLYEIELKRALSAGEYSATLHYSTFSPDDLSELNGADVPFVLSVK